MSHSPSRSARTPTSNGASARTASASASRIASPAAPRRSNRATRSRSHRRRIAARSSHAARSKARASWGGPGSATNRSSRRRRPPCGMCSRSGRWPAASGGPCRCSTPPTAAPRAHISRATAASAASGEPSGSKATAAMRARWGMGAEILLALRPLANAVPRKKAGAERGSAVASGARLPARPPSGARRVTPSAAVPPRRAPRPARAASR